ncbi:unnamed protein product, partial [Mesorhabditis spiculigera]
MDVEDKSKEVDKPTGNDDPTSVADDNVAKMAALNSEAEDEQTEAAVVTSSEDVRPPAAKRQKTDDVESEPARRRSPSPGPSTSSQPGPSTSAVASPAFRREDMAWVPPTAPPKYLSRFKELLKQTNCTMDIFIMHEAALDPNFKIEDIPKTPLEEVVEKQCKVAFWDLLKEDLSSNPPNYNYAFNVLLDIKEFIRSKLIFRTSKSHGAQTIWYKLKDVIDDDELKDQIKSGRFDMKRTVNGIADVLSRLCAPVRDEKVVELRKETNMIEALKKIFEMLDLIDLDITNFLIKATRQMLVTDAQKNEREWFEKKRADGGDVHLRRWLTLAVKEADKNPPSASSATPETPQAKTRRITSRGYVKLIQSGKLQAIPETLLFDMMRIAGYAEKFLQMTICTAALSISINVAGKEYLKHDAVNLKNKLIIISNDIDFDNLPHVLELLAEESVREVQDYALANDIAITAQRFAELKAQIRALVDPNNAVRNLIRSSTLICFSPGLDERVSLMLERLLAEGEDVKPPSVLEPVQQELRALKQHFTHFCRYNQDAFMEIYTEIISEIEAENQLAETIAADVAGTST